MAREMVRFLGLGDSSIKHKMRQGDGSVVLLLSSINIIEASICLKSISVKIKN